MHWDVVNDRRGRVLGNISHVIVAISDQTQLVYAYNQSADSKMASADPPLLQQPDPQLLKVKEEKQDEEGEMMEEIEEQPQRQWRLIGGELCEIKQGGQVKEEDENDVADSAPDVKEEDEDENEVK